MSHSQQRKSWLRLCSVDRRLTTPWPSDGLRDECDDEWTTIAV